MKSTRYLLPLTVILLGAALLSWQRWQINAARQAAAGSTPHSPASSTPPGNAGPNSGSLPAGANGSRQSGQPVSGNVSTGDFDLAGLTGGMEKEIDLTQGIEIVARSGLSQKVADLTPAQAQAAFATVTRKLSNIDPVELEAGKTSDPAQMRAILLLLPIMSRLQRESPATLLEWIANPATPAFLRTAGRFTEEAVASYTRQDPTAAITWLEKNEATLPEAQRAWPAALGALALTDLPRALREATERGIIRETSSTMIPALTTPEARRLWSTAVSAFDDPARRDRRWSALVEEQIRSAGWEPALQVLSGELPAEARTPRNLAAIMDSGLSTAPATLASRIAGLPDNTAPKIMPELIARWTERDYNAAATWLRTAPADAAWRDPAIAALVGRITAIDPAAARSWAAVIKDPALRPIVP